MFFDFFFLQEEINKENKHPSNQMICKKISDSPENWKTKSEEKKKKKKPEKKKIKSYHHSNHYGPK